MLRRQLVQIKEDAAIAKDLNEASFPKLPLLGKNRLDIEEEKVDTALNLRNRYPVQDVMFFIYFLNLLRTHAFFLQ